MDAGETEDATGRICALDATARAPEAVARKRGARHLMTPLTEEERARALSARHLVRRLARRLARGGRFLEDDLVSAGNEALLKAARRFDPSLGVPFAAFALRRIQGEMVDGGNAARRSLPARLSDAARSATVAPSVAATGGDPYGPCPGAAAWAEHQSETLLRATFEVDLVSTPLEELELRQEQARYSAALRRAIATLAPLDATLVELHDLQEVPLKKVSHAVGLAYRTAKRRRAAALKVLRRIMRALGFDGPPLMSWV